MTTIDAGGYVTNPNGKSLVLLFLSSPGFRFMFFYRLCRKYSSKTPLGMIVRMWFKNLQVKYGFQIPHSCKIGRGLYLGHYGNIVINQKAIIGDNCNVAQGVTIGIINRGKKAGCPTIGDRVWVGANAVIVGNIHIGNDALIAPLSYVTEDVPDRGVVAGNPAKLINFNSSEGYINNII